MNLSLDEEINHLKNYAIPKLNELQSYSIQYGILDENYDELIEVNVVNLDGTSSKTTMPVGDVMYFTEHGTMTLPARHILQKAMMYCDKLASDTFNDLCVRITSTKVNDSEIISELNLLAFKIEMYCKNLFNSEISSINKVGSILNKDDENQYLCDLNKLSKYIKCKIIKKY